MGTVGKFTFEDDGFTFDFKVRQRRIKWSDLKSLTAYKADMLTYDNIRMDIVMEDWQFTISEDTPGWSEFVDITKSVFPEIPKDWDLEIIHSSFAGNEIILYEKR